MSKKYKHPIPLSFLYAGKGIIAAFKERNFIIHLIFTCAVIFLGFYLNISTWQWMAIIISIAMVLCTELINTAIEKTIDLLHPDYHPKAGLIKDLAAAAVLVASISAIAIGLMVFIPLIF